ncbi:L,D-transpeptidase family protein [Marinicauda pacifica]|uniref:L,D-transpeptidase family protein n=1 Tax=Marinicauda pacifica TaxID=1133559 RepID=UPI0035C8042C
MIAVLRTSAALFACLFSLALPAPALAEGCRACEASTLFYDGRADALAWTGPANAHLMDDLLRAVRGAASHGLNPAHYHLAVLEATDAAHPNREADALATDAYLTLADHLWSGRLDPVTIEPDWTALRRGGDLAIHLQAALASSAVFESLEALAPPQADYQALRDALARYREVAAAGGWPATDLGPALHPDERGPRVAQLRARLAATGDIEAQSADPELFDAALADGVRSFQTRAGLDADGIVGARTLHQLNATPGERIAQIRANLERWRWLPEEMGRRHIRVNIADFSLEARADGVVEREHDVIVGQLYRKTPVFSGNMTYFILNPWWETPVSLAVRDKLPVFRENPDEVGRLGFQVIDRDGVLVDPATIDWPNVPAANFPYRLRQAPGPLNALGQVKFMFPNPHNVYLHDTPTRGLFARSRRDFSSGCVRVQNWQDLAEWVAADTPDWTPERIDAAIAGGRETRVTLAGRVLVHILYWTALPDAETGVRFVDDIYGRDPALLAALDASPPPLESR